MFCLTASYSRIRFFQASVFGVQPILFFGQFGIFLAQLGKTRELITDARRFQRPRRRFKENDFTLTSAQILFLVTGFLVFAIQRLWLLVGGGMLYQQHQILIRFVENSLVFLVFLHTGFQVVALDDSGDAAEVFVSIHMGSDP